MFGRGSLLHTFLDVNQSPTSCRFELGRFTGVEKRGTKKGMRRGWLGESLERLEISRRLIKALAYGKEAFRLPPTGEERKLADQMVHTEIPIARYRLLN
jgi:hypothetical protein